MGLFQVFHNFVKAPAQTKHAPVTTAVKLIKTRGFVKSCSTTSAVIVLNLEANDVLSLELYKESATRPNACILLVYE